MIYDCDGSNGSESECPSIFSILMDVYLYKVGRNECIDMSFAYNLNCLNAISSKYFETQGRIWKFSYVGILKKLKNYGDISFQFCPESRALGLWLWDEMRQKEEKEGCTIQECISFLKSGAIFPADLLNRFGFADSAVQTFRKMHDRAAACVQAGEVLSLR